MVIDKIKKFNDTDKSNSEKNEKVDYKLMLSGKCRVIGTEAMGILNYPETEENFNITIECTIKFPKLL